MESNEKDPKNPDYVGPERTEPYYPGPDGDVKPKAKSMLIPSYSVPPRETVGDVIASIDAEFLAWKKERGLDSEAVTQWPKDEAKPTLADFYKEHYRESLFEFQPFTEEQKLIQSLEFEDFNQLPDAEPEIIIEGLLRIGEKLGITGGSKQFKTWILLYIAYCIANGFEFLGFKTRKLKVLYFDFELSRFGLKRRLRRIQKAVGAGDFENLKICSLRGKARAFCDNFQTLADRIKCHAFKVIIFDPIYKFLLGKNESDNGVVAAMLDRLTVFCMETQVSIIYVHHHSKGNQAAKEAIDRSSGAGSWSRDPDCVLDISEHEDSKPEDRIFTIEITVRDFPPVEKFVAHWEMPILTRRNDEELDPDNIKRPKTAAGRPASDVSEQILIALRVAECVAELAGLTAKQLNMVTRAPLRTVQRHAGNLKKTGQVCHCALINGYQLSLSERTKNTE